MSGPEADRGPAVPLRAWTQERRRHGLLLQRPTPWLVEVCARRLGADLVILDLQHGIADLAGLDACLAVGRAAGLRCFVRVVDPSEHLLTVLVDGAADGVVLAMVEDVEVCRRVRSITRFAPEGTRSVNTGSRAIETGARPPAVIAMIESRRALDGLDGIAADPSVDAVYFGPADLQLSLTDGSTHRPDAATWERIADGARRARAAGALVGANASPADLVDHFDFLTFGTEAHLLEGGWRAATDAVADAAAPR